MRVCLALRTLLATLVLVGLTAGNILLPPSSAAAAGLSLSRHNAAAHDGVTVSGSGYSPGDTVVVSADFRTGSGPQHVQASGTANGSGYFQATLTVPAGTRQGTYTVTAKDFHGHSASAALNVLPRAYIAAGGKVGTIWVIPSHSFYVSGAGFKPGEKVSLSATFPLYNGNSSTVSHTVQANGKGGFYEVMLAVPTGAKKGTVTLTATGQTSKKTGKESLHVFYHPTLSVAAQSYRPGTTVKVTGTGFAPGASVRVALTVSRTNAADVTISRTVTANGGGNITAYLPLPSVTRVATYHVRAHGNLSGATATAAVVVSVKPSISVSPTSVLPGQSFTVSGSNFGAGALVRVHATFPVSGGGNRWVGKPIHAGANGNYSVQLTAPGDAAAGNVTVWAVSPNARVHTALRVQPKPAPKPSPTPTPTPTPTPKPSHPKPHHAKHTLGYRWISVWYHVMRMGTREHVVLQSTLHVKQGIWVHVWFPAGQHYAYFQNTDRNGRWSKWFLVPWGSMTKRNHMALITFRLWHGKDNVKDWRKFKIVR